jgi:pyridoxamine 5'-phosphate oxidase
VYKDAKKCASIKHPEAMTLSTINNGCPDSRVVLLKTIDNTGFIFFTNYESSKGKDLEKNPNACMLFYWEKLKRQVRIRGTVERTQSTLIAPLLNTFLKTTASIKKKINKKINISDSYFSQRQRESQIGAWASNQSQEIKGKDELEERIKRVEEKFKNKEIPRPPYWGGYRLIPTQIEFWEEKEFRLHERLLYTKDNNQWETKVLSP